MLSRGGSWYARTILGLPFRDLTGGFRCWRRSVLENLDLPSIRSNGYSFQIEMLFRAARNGPRNRRGADRLHRPRRRTSKMSKKIVIEAMGVVWKLRAQAGASRPAARSRFPAKARKL
jgi:dolichol-phosphate mannosyltransferase